MEYDIIFANITAKKPFASFFRLLAFPFFITHFAQKVNTTFSPKSQVVFKPLANDTQSQKALKKTNYTLSKLKLVGIILFPACKSQDNFPTPPSLSLLGKV
jgi:hypothetical protein